MASSEVSYTEARERLAELWDRAISDREPIRLTRRGAEPVVLVAAEEYDGLRETANLLRSPANAMRLISALERALTDSGEPRTFMELREEFDADEP